MDVSHARLAGRRVVASVSGGKDSAALSLWLHEQGIEHDRVFLDTGWEHERTYEYIRGELQRVIGPITEIRAVRQMEDLVLHKGMFPSRTRRFCTQELKVVPMQRYLSERVSRGEDLVNAVGIRHEESAARAGLDEWEWSEGFDCEVWRPLIRWTEEEVIAIHRRHGLRPNPLYLLGASRVGCWPCIYARKAELRLIADTDPDRIRRIRALEEQVATAARARYERDRADWLSWPPLAPSASDYDSPEKHAAAESQWKSTMGRLMRPFSAPAWFQAQAKGPDGHYPMLPIDQAVAWSRTSFGGRQFEMFMAPERERGCMRWGLCETDGGAGT